MTRNPDNPRCFARLLGGMLLYALCTLAPAAGAPQEIEVPAWFKNSFLDLRDDIREAAAANKRVMIYFGQNGCPYCKQLMDVNFSQKDIVDKTRNEKEFTALLKVQFTPTLLFLDEKGGIALRVNGYYPPHRFHAALDYVSQRNEHKVSFAEFQKDYQREPDSGVFHDEPFFRKPPYGFDRRKPAARPLAVFFEQQNCSGCDEMHATALKAERTRQLLSRFDVYRLNLHGKDEVVTPAGAKTTAAQWARDLNVLYAPSVVFFGGGGKEVFRVEAYVRTFHLQSALDYVASGAYRKEPSFQRYLQARAETIRERGGRVDLMR